MKSLNRVFLMGHLGSNPELQTSRGGRQYTRLNVATHRAWKDDEQERQERTDWHSVFVWGQLAETCASYLTKGALVFVEGTLNQYESDASAGSSVTKQSIHAQSVRFLSRQLDNPEVPRNHDAVVHLG